MSDTSSPGMSSAAQAAARKASAEGLGLAVWVAQWKSRSSRERQAVGLALALLAGLLLWMLALRPALSTLREAPQQLATLDAQLQAMQVQAAEAAQLRASPKLPREQATEALKLATESLGDKARLTLQGERATVVFTGVTTSALRDWLQAARSTARISPQDATLTRAGEAWNGTVVAIFGAAP